MYCQIHGYGCSGMCTQQNMAAQQQLSNQLAQHYNQLLGMAPRPQDVHRVADVIDKKTESNKQKLLLLLR